MARLVKPQLVARVLNSGPGMIQPAGVPPLAGQEESNDEAVEAQQEALGDFVTSLDDETVEALLAGAGAVTIELRKPPGSEVWVRADKSS